MDFSSHVSSLEKRNDSELCLVLVGSISCGKTLTADTLLGQSSTQRPSGSSRECQVRRGLSEGRRLSVVETPRWYWRGGQVEDDIRAETRRALDPSIPGPRVFLILIPVNEFTEMEQRIPDQLEQMFGPSVLSHTVVLLTCGDYLGSRSLEQYLSREAALREVVRRCGGRCHVINNRKPQDRQQVVTLLEEVEQMILMNGGFKEIQEPVRDQMLERNWRGFTDQRTRISTEETETDATIETRLVNGLHSQQQHYEFEETNFKHSALESSSSFQLTKEGAILSNMLEVSDDQNNQSYVNTIHHSFGKVLNGSETISTTSTSTWSSSDLLSDSSLPELRIVLLGRRGSGKSEAGNLLLGCEVFDADEVTATSQQCVKSRALVQDHQVSVVHTPDWFDSERSPEEVKSQISSCVALCAPGPHVFLLCIPVNRPGNSELPALRALEGVFGPDAVRRHTVVLFTRSELLEGVSGVEGVEAYIASKQPEMLELVQKCGDRYHVLQRGDRGGLTELLEKVRQTVRESGGDYYSCSLYPEAGSHVQRRQEEISAAWRERQRDKEDRKNSTFSLHALNEEEEEEQQLVAGAEKNVRLDSAALLSSCAKPPSVLRSILETAGSGAKRVPKELALGALVGAVLGVFLAGTLGGAVGVALGSVVSEIGRRRYGKHKIE
ncbi:GTPase IMAP family member 8 [Paramisgurnus dabryanus]|uniref:GTPase IMAP family member 8 n=1 Tax=Paramisgurnus dabryanus TaxID=90735 RepID=UPI0031F3C66C